MNRSISASLFIFVASGLSACVSGGDRRADLRIIFHDQVARCYTLPGAAIGTEATAIEVRLNLDGSLAQAPRVLQGIAGSDQARAAVAAVTRCAPFQIPAGIAQHYRQWRTMVITFNTGVMRP
jgi:colicin import membrane protein